MSVQTYDRSRSPVTASGAALAASFEVDVVRCRAVARELTEAGLFQPAAGTATAPDSTKRWRLAASPFWLSAAEAAFFEQLGAHLQAFYLAVNQLYHASRKGQQPEWVRRYFDQGKPEPVIDYGRMSRFKARLPGVIRPDLIPLPLQTARSGPALAMTELDAVPGGIGLTAALARAYTHGGATGIIGGLDGMIDGFGAMIRAAIAQHRSHADVGAQHAAPLLAIVVSEESQDYRAEMRWLAAQLRQRGHRAVTVAPEEVRFTEHQLECDIDGRSERIDVLYRFFELFDLKNIPKTELFLYAAKKGLVAMTPPPKTYLEEKSAFALLHHPALRSFWRSALPAETLALL
ncbi:MAG: hypothetical protein AB1515_10715, partial [Nitrospirota bacterium]